MLLQTLITKVNLVKVTYDFFLGYSGWEFNQLEE